MPRSLRQRLLLPIGLAVGSLLLLTACAQRDPFLRDDVWKPTGANAGNLAAMVANPNDLVVGRHTSRSDTKASTIAIQHIWDGTPQSLSGSSSGGSSSSSGSSGSGGGSGGSSSGSGGVGSPTPLSGS
jgi:type IV pilus biogenesis protein CpaD/CtpE